MIGRVFLGRYEIQRLLGEGGMGKVYLARQVDLGRTVVVKVMHDHVAADARFRERFQRETLLMARFQHPHAVTLYDASLNDPLGPCIVMEYVKGVNLETMLAKSSRFTAPRVARIIAPLCEVLQAAHDEGIIHRDLKPANLMVIDPDTPKERIKVMDFGLAKLMDDSGSTRRVTDTNVDFAVGTPGYIAPEQVRGEALDHRGDLYSVGVMMYELLTGRLPFIGATSMDVLLAHATESPPSMAELGLSAWVPPQIEELVFSCLAKDPDDRPQSARELAERMESALSSAQFAAGSGGVSSAAANQSVHRQHGLGAATEDRPNDIVALELEKPQAASTAVTTSRTTPNRPHSSSRDETALPFHMDAWMPEAIAIMKLRGYIHDCGGEVLESVPGLIRVRLGKGSRLPWLGFGRRSLIDVELHLHRTDPKNENRLTIHVLFRPGHVSQLADEAWRNRVSRIFVELRAYLMGAPSDSN
jgi:serine/threonine-protein kinase